MNPERWDRIKELFECALEREPADRPVFLAGACAGDDDLHAEVAQLLVRHESAQDFLEHPPVPVRGLAFASRPLRSVFSAEQIVSGRFRIVQTLGHGGMGEVYEALDLELHDRVALKTIRQDIASDSRFIERFKREVQRSRTISHPNVCRVYDLFRDGGTGVADVWFLTMELLRGETLAERIRRQGRLDTAAALPLVKQMCAALDAAHHSGVVHRDFKSGNVMLVTGSHHSTIRVVVTDFGLARPISAIDASSSWSDDLGKALGTPAYMAPEQLEGKPATAASDVYALGLVIYEMITGTRPFVGDSALSVAIQRLTESPPTPRAHVPDLDARWEQTILRCLERNPGARFPNARQVCGALADSTPALITAPVDAIVKAQRRGLKPRLLALAAAMLTAVGGTAYWAASRGGPADLRRERPPLSILIADFENRSNDPVFEGALEQALSIAIEGASFVTAYPRLTAQQLAEQLKPGSRLDESMARLISAREGIKVILAGTIEAASGGGYSLSVRALDPAPEPAQRRPLAVATASVPSRDQVLGAVGSLASRVRDALGDTTPESVRLAAAETVTSASLEAMRAYARGQQLAAANRIPDALEAYQQAVTLDPRFGRAYAGMGVIYANIKDEVKARASFEDALRNIDRMTDREKHRTLGIYSLLVSRNYEQAVESFKELVRLYPADDVGHGNLALAYLNLGNLQDAVEEVRKSLAIYPKDFVGRYNYAMYSMYANDFATAITEGTRVLEENPSFQYGFIPIAVSHLAQGNVGAARDAYARLERLGAEGQSLASLGRADLEMYYGRPKSALGILRAGLAADEKRNSTGETAQKYVATAEAHLALGERALAREAAAKAVRLSRHESVLFPAARALLLAGDEAHALKVARALDDMLQRQTVAYGRLIAGEIAIRQGRLAAGLEALREAQKRHNSWFSHFLLGKTYAEAGHYPEALAELELCFKRRGETTDVFFYDTPTLRYLAAVHYWLGRTREALRVSAEARKNYEAYLKLRADADTADSLAEDARRRLKRLEP